MNHRQPKNLTRRAFLWRGLTIPAALVLAACGGRPFSEVFSDIAGGEPEADTTLTLLPTPACDDGDEPTIAQTEGPFYTPDTPLRTSFLGPDVTGLRMVLRGYVLTTDCQPVAGALVDFWHADDAGVYDNAGYKLRGHQFTDANGRYTLETIRPGLYPGRTRHFHVKVQAANQPVLTTQLYFPDEPGNASDGIFNPLLLMQVQIADEGLLGAFNFVLNI